MLQEMRTRITERRKEMKLSEREVSRRAGRGLSFVNDLMHKVKDAPDARAVLDLANALEVAPVELLGDGDEAAAIRREIALIQNRVPPRDAQAFDAPAAVSIPLYRVETAGGDSAHLRDQSVGRVANAGMTPMSYAVEVFNSANEPRFFFGERVIASPMAQARLGDWVVVRANNQRCAIGKLQALTVANVVVELIGEGRTVEFPQDDGPQIHKIEGVIL